MKIQKASIATARIHGLKKPPYPVNGSHSYAWDISFSDASTLRFENILTIIEADTIEEAEAFFHPIKRAFRKAKIHDDDKVAILFDEAYGNIIAIGCLGKDAWVEVKNHHFTKKDFDTLNIVISSLKVY